MAPIRWMGAPLINQIKTLRFVTLFIACKLKKNSKDCLQYTHGFSQISHIRVLMKKKMPVWLFFLFINCGSANPEQASPWENPIAHPLFHGPGNSHGPGLRCIV